MQNMQHIIQDFKHFIDLCGENLWVQGSGFEENFKIYVDTPENHLDDYLSSQYEGTPLWFYFLCFDYTLFDYFKERIPLKTDWDYTLLFNVDFIESSHYFVSNYQHIYYSTLTPFCPLNVLSQVIKKSEHFHGKFNFSFPTVSFEKLSQPDLSLSFFKHAKIDLSLASLSHIISHDYETGIEIIHALMNNTKFKDSFISELSKTRTEDFFTLKINLLFQYPQVCPESFQQKLNPEELHKFVTHIIVQKQSVDKQLLFKLMGKEHLILAITNQYFSSEEISSLIQDKEIRYHLLDYKLSCVSKESDKSSFKKNKI